MNNTNTLQPEEHKLLTIVAHFMAITWIVSSQTIMIAVSHSTVSGKGWLTFLAQTTVYLTAYYWVIPDLFSKKKIATSLLRLSIIVSIYFTVRGLISYKGKNVIEFFHFIISFNQVAYSSVHLIIVIGLNCLIGLYRHNEQLNKKYIKALEGMLTAEKEKARIESIVTQMRLSPHLMFNTLNYIQQKADGISPEIYKAVNLYSGIVRHSMIDVLETKTVAISKEIAEIKTQIELHNLLADGSVHIEFEEQYHEAIEDAMIPPSTLLTFVENVFRYGLVKDPDYPPRIKVKIIENQFTFSTWNYKRSDPHHGTGTGIKSVATTLGYYYPGLYSLDIENLEETFRLTLRIQL